MDYTSNFPVISKMLDASTAHVTPSDLKLMAQTDDQTNPVCAFQKAEYGWFVYVPDCNLEEDFDSLSLQLYGYSPAFIKLLKVAEQHGCGWINLDCDGTVMKDLPIYPR